MRHLPPDIWQRVFIQLELKARLRCTLVCRNWWNILDSTCLLYSVEIYGNELKFIRFMDMIKKSPHRAAQTQVLKLYDCIVESFDKREICNIFPNARIINVTSSEFDDTSFIECTEHLKMKHSKPTVQVLLESGTCVLTRQIMDSNMCGRLKKLELDLRKSAHSSPNIFTKLRNMPLLKELSLRTFSGTVMDLETIHENLPTLQKLLLDRVSPNISEIPDNVTPAGLTKLHYFSAVRGNQMALPMWYNYMSKKYTNVTQFVYEDTSISYIDADMVRQTYENGLVQFLQLIGPYIDHQLLLRVPDGVNVFEALDRSDSKTKSFYFLDCQGGTLLEFLAQSNQARYVEKMQLYNTAISTPNSFQNLTSLTRIEFSFGPFDARAVTNFTSYLNEFPASLEECVFMCSGLHVNPESTNSSRIKYLEIYCKELTKELGYVISNCFPRLTKLSIKADVSESLNINIQSPDFQSAAFLNPGRKSYDRGFSYKSGSQSNSSHYLWCPDGIVDTEYESIHDLPIISFVSPMEKKIVVTSDDGVGIWVLPVH